MEPNKAQEKRGLGRNSSERKGESVSGQSRTAGGKEGGVNGEGNGAETHRASVSGAGQPAEKNPPLQRPTEWRSLPGIHPFSKQQGIQKKQ